MESLWGIAVIALMVVFALQAFRAKYCQSCGKMLSRKKLAKTGGVCPDCGGTRFGKRDPRSRR